MIEARPSASLSAKIGGAGAHQSFFDQFQKTAQPGFGSDPLAADAVEIVLATLLGIVRAIEDIRQQYLQPIGRQNTTEQSVEHDAVE